MEKKPVKIVETVLRDGHQSLAATRMRISDMLPALEQLDNAGYYALEAWGGATFDSCLRFLNEDPWQRLRTLKKHLRKTPIQMLLRGQNILGYNHYADDVVREKMRIRHVSHTGNKRGKSTDDRNKTGDDDGFATVFFKKCVRFFQMIFTEHFGIWILK